MSNGSTSENIFSLGEVIVGPDNQVVFDSEAQSDDQPEQEKEDDL